MNVLVEKKKSLNICLFGVFILRARPGSWDNVTATVGTMAPTPDFSDLNIWGLQLFQLILYIFHDSHFENLWCV